MLFLESYEVITITLLYIVKTDLELIQELKDNNWKSFSEIRLNLLEDYMLEDNLLLFRGKLYI